MINIPLDVITSRIKEETGISDSELMNRITAKLEQLSGLISKEGAAHIVANELGVKLMQAKGILKIKHLMTGMKAVEIAAKVIRKYETRAFKNEKREGKVAKFLVGDDTGTTMVVLWNDQTDLMSRFDEGATVRITGGNVRDNNGRTEIHLTDSSTIDVNPEGIKIDASARRESAARKKISELVKEDNNVEIFATIVQVFDPKFFDSCPECNKRMQPSDGVLACAEHGKLTPNINSVLNIFVDDGSDNIRVVLWKQQALELLGMNDQKLASYRVNASDFESVKTELLGMMARFVGRVQNNEMFGRPEFVANRVHVNVKPEEEMKKLNVAAKENATAPKPAAAAPAASAQKDSFDDDLDDILSLEDLEDVSDE